VPVLQRAVKEEACKVSYRASTLSIK
jgi:hypothetical protein